MCVGCGRRTSQGELRRIARHPDGTVVVGRQQPGRGAWLCRGRECLEAARSRGTLERALRTTIPPREFEALRARLMATMDAPAGD